MEHYTNNAEQFLTHASELMRERGMQYDKGQERSMPRAVNAFNAITGNSLTEEEGWLLMQCVKMVRQSNTEGFHQDSYEDEIAYAALKAESAQKVKGGQ